MNDKDFWAMGETFTGFDFIDWTARSLVYGWFRGDECLYIGQTGRGLHRIINHDVINVAEPVMDYDEIRITPAFELADRLDLEETLIKRHKPKYNKSKNEEHYYATHGKPQKIQLERPKVEDLITALPNRYLIKSIYTPSE